MKIHGWDKQAAEKVAALTGGGAVRMGRAAAALELTMFSLPEARQLLTAVHRYEELFRQYDTVGRARLGGRAVQGSAPAWSPGLACALPPTRPPLCSPCS